MFMHMRNLAALLTALVLLALACGCASAGREPATDNMPWNTPAAWEGGVLGIPY